MKKIIPWILVVILAVALVLSNLPKIRPVLSDNSESETITNETQTDSVPAYNSSFTLELACKCVEIINKETESKTDYQNVWFDIVDIDYNGAPELLFVCRGDGYKNNQNYLYHITDSDLVLISDEMVGNYVKTFCENGSVIISMTTIVSGTGISSVAAYRLNSSLSDFTDSVAYYGSTDASGTIIEAYMNSNPIQLTNSGDIAISIDEYNSAKIKYGYYSESMLHDVNSDGLEISRFIFEQFGMNSESMIIVEFSKVLNENQYEAGEIPTFALYDFNSDGIDELLVWDKRIGSAIDREIKVFKYDETKGAEYVGSLWDFEGHSRISEASDGNGIVIGIMDNDVDNITRYYYENGKIYSETLLKRTTEDSAEWSSILDSGEYFSSRKIERFDDLESLKQFIKY